MRLQAAGGSNSAIHGQLDHGVYSSARAPVKARVRERIARTVRLVRAVARALPAIISTLAVRFASSFRLTRTRLAVLLVLFVCAWFAGIEHRSLTRPDEGRYSEI